MVRQGVFALGSPHIYVVGRATVVFFQMLLDLAEGSLMAQTIFCDFPSRRPSSLNRPTPRYTDLEAGAKAVRFQRGGQ